MNLAPATPLHSTSSPSFRAGRKRRSGLLSWPGPTTILTVVKLRSEPSYTLLHICAQDDGGKAKELLLSPKSDHNWLPHAIIANQAFCGVRTMEKSEIHIFGFRGFPGVQGGVETHVENLAPQLVQIGHRVAACVRSPYVDKQCKEWKGVRLLRLWTVRNAYFEALLHSLIVRLWQDFAGRKSCTSTVLDRLLLSHCFAFLVYELSSPTMARTTIVRNGAVRHALSYASARHWECALRIDGSPSVAASRSSSPLSMASPAKLFLTASFHKSAAGTNKVVELGLAPGRYVLTVGRLVPEKRQLDLLRAFRGAGLSGWKLAIVGRIDHKNKYADLLASEAALAEDVVMAGFQSGNSLRQLYAHAGLFVLPSSHEGLPIALLEALSYGLPVLVSDIPSNLEVVGDRIAFFEWAISRN